MDTSRTDAVDKFSGPRRDEQQFQDVAASTAATPPSQSSIQRGDAAGLGRGRLRGSDLVPLFRGVRLPTDVAVTDESVRAAYMTRMRPGQAFSHLTAARVWGIPLPHEFTVAEGVHVSVRAPRTPPSGPGTTGHRISDPHAHAIVRAGIPVVDAATTWCHLAMTLVEDDLVAAGDHLVLTPAIPDRHDPRPFVTLAQLQQRVDRYHGPGARAARAAIRHVRDGSESRRETLLRLILLRAGLPEPELNVDIFTESGRWIGRADQVFRDWKTIAEYDGEQHRTSDRQYERDEVKIEELGHAGWKVVRIRKKALLFGGAEAVERVSRALRSRGWTP
jgi:hypothetical protein